MTRPPVNLRAVVVANTAARAASMPFSRLRDIYDQAVALATCEGPARFYTADANAEAARRTAWCALAAARRARIDARTRLRLIHGSPEGAA